MPILPPIISKEHKRKGNKLRTLKISEGTWPEHAGVLLSHTDVLMFFKDGKVEVVGTCQHGSQIVYLDSNSIIIQQP